MLTVGQLIEITPKLINTRVGSSKKYSADKKFFSYKNFDENRLILILNSIRLFLKAEI